MKPAMQALFDYAAAPDRQGYFSTSWTTYGMCETPEEALVTAAVIEEYGQEAFDKGDIEWIEVVPLMLLNACIEALAETWGETDGDDPADDAIKRIGTFVGEMFYDLTSCHVRDT